MENPYESSRPAFAKSADPANFEIRTSGELPQGRVGEVRFVSILMIVQGVLECFYGLFCLAFAVFSGFALSSPEFAEAMGPNSEQQAVVTVVIYGFLSLLGFVPGVLHIMAGRQNYRFHGRTLGFVALAGGIISAFSGCCCPTTLALGIYGMIVFLDPSVALAFELGSQGNTREEILKQFQLLDSA